MKARALQDLARSYFDAGYYLSQTGDVGQAEPFKHYLDEGTKRGFSPCRYFEQDWYEWQNPDYTDTHENGFYHYLELGRRQGRDPSPLVDMVALMENFGAQDAVALSDAVLSERAPYGCGVYADYDELTCRQKQFHRAIRPSVLRYTKALDRRKHLVIVQAGKSGAHHAWFDPAAERNWDLCVNLYDVSDATVPGAEFIVAQTGTKTTAMAIYASSLDHVLRGYDYVLFLDDDVSVSFEAVNQAFETCAKHQLDVAQMSLSPVSHCVWPVFFSKPGSRLRYTNGVEIMMPIFSARCFQACRELFGRSVSGFGLDLAIGQRAGTLGRQNVAVLDECVAEHLRPIDAHGGALYAFLRSVGINPKAELWHLKTMLQTPAVFAEV